MVKFVSLKRKRAERAQSLVEMAISLMAILMLLLGAVEISLALFQYVSIRDASQEGALYGSINPTDTAGIKLHAESVANDVLVIDDSNITVDAPVPCEGLTGGSPNVITVTITYPHHIIFPIVGPMLGVNTITLKASATNTILQTACDAP